MDLGHCIQKALYQLNEFGSKVHDCHSAQLERMVDPLISFSKMVKLQKNCGLLGGTWTSVPTL